MARSAVLMALYCAAVIVGHQQAACVQLYYQAYRGLANGSDYTTERVLGKLREWPQSIKDESVHRKEMVAVLMRAEDKSVKLGGDHDGYSIEDVLEFVKIRLGQCNKSHLERLQTICSTYIAKSDERFGRESELNMFKNLVAVCQPALVWFRQWCGLEHQNAADLVVRAHLDDEQQQLLLTFQKMLYIEGSVKIDISAIGIAEDEHIEEVFHKLLRYQREELPKACKDLMAIHEVYPYYDGSGGKIEVPPNTEYWIIIRENCVKLLGLIKLKGKFL